MWGLSSAVLVGAAGLLASVFAGGAARADVVRIGGTGAGTITLAAIAEQAAAGSGVVLQPLPSLGSAGGMRALNAGRIDLAILGRLMMPDEAKSGARVVAEIRTPFVFVTSLSAAPVMTGAEIVEAFGNQRARWRDGGPIALVLRQRTDGDAILLNTMLAGMDAALEQARTRPEVLVSIVDDDNADLAERTKGSLATMSYNQLMVESRKLRAIAINGVAPSLKAYEDGSYPYGRPFYLVVPATPSAATMRFVAFLQSERGQDVLRGVHSVLGRAP